MSDATRTQTAPMVPTAAIAGVGAIELAADFGTVTLTAAEAKSFGRKAGETVKVKGWSLLGTGGNPALEVIADDDDDIFGESPTLDRSRVTRYTAIAVKAGTKVPTAVSVAAFGESKSAAMTEHKGKAYKSADGTVKSRPSVFVGEASYIRPNGATYVFTVSIRPNVSGTAWRIGCRLAQ